MDYIITTNDLTKQYGDKLAANKINLHVPRGKVYGLIGRNGAGKTTILKMLCGLSIPSSGSFSFNGKEGKELAAEMKKIGCLIENPGLYPNLSAYQNLKIKCIAMGKSDPEYIKGLLELVGLGKVGKKSARNFSLGMKQRLGIALALAGDPEFIVLDEPINGLDPQGIVEMREIIARLSHERGITVIVSSHILDELHRVADSFGIIHDGRLVDELTAEELNFRCGEYTIVKSNDSDELCKCLGELGYDKVTVAEHGEVYISNRVDEPAVLLRQLVEKGIAVSEFTLKQSTLEEYYLRKTGGASRA